MLSQLISIQLKAAAVRPGPLLLWDLAAFLAILELPSQWRLGTSFWTLPAQEMVQVWVWGAAFLLLALALRVGTRRARGLGIVSISLITIACWSVAYLFLALLPTVANSRMVALASVALGTALAFLPFSPHLFGRKQKLAAAVLTTATLAIVARGQHMVTQEQSTNAVVATRVSSALYPLSVTTYKNVFDSAELEGGAIEPLGDGFVVVTAEGEFWDVTWEHGVELRARQRPITAPLNRAQFLKDRGDDQSIIKLRVLDFVFDSPREPTRVYVSHQYWNAVDRCFTIRISVAAFSVDMSERVEPASWETLFESAPCLTISEEFDDIETGGRLTWLDRRTLLLTVGDHGFSGLTGGAVFAQDSLVSYGKILRIGIDGRHSIFTMGHRNPQGLVIGRDGVMWSTEHGPQGGDEVNVIADGENYGWPLVTYGTQYGLYFWPLDSTGRDHGRYREPAHVFVPSIGISNLIQVGGTLFPNWDGDLLVSSLGAQALYRVRAGDRRVIYVEPIPIGRRIRDLAEGRDGRLVLWTGARDVVVVARAEPSAGKAAYSACSSCHGSDLGGTASAPSLLRLFERNIGASSRFEFSPALKRLEGKWDDARLDAFLRDPGSYAPGTTMHFPGVPDPEVRRAAIEYLHNF